MTKKKSLKPKLNCLICRGLAEIHHALTQKTYPELKDEKWNQFELCRSHHTEWHQLAPTEMASKYFQVAVALRNKGWQLIEEEKNKTKWWPPRHTKEKV